jgi:hypothetical protein
MGTNKSQTEQLTQDAVMQSVIKSLQIGNFIYFGKSICKVVEIQKTCFYVENGEGEEFKSTWADLSLIKLTEEIISKICFNENKVMGMYRLQATDDYTIAFSLDNDMIYIGDDIEIRISETPLHRFQNIFHSLTGRELTVA